MHYRTALFILLLALLAGLLGYNYYAKPFAQLQPVVELMQPTPTPPVTEDPAAAILANLSTQEKVAQLIAFPLNLSTAESTISADLDWVRLHQPGVVTLFGNQISTSSAQAAVAEIKTESALHQPLVAVDHEGGLVQRLSGAGFTQLPSWQQLCNLAENEREEWLSSSAQELQAAGIDIVFAPVVDVASSSSSLGNRICSSDPEVIIARAGELIEQYANYQLLPVLKHFPGIGSARTDLHFNFARVELTEADLIVYQRLLSQYDYLGVMTTHVGIVNRFDEVPCSLNRTCLQDLTTNFNSTLIFTDALDMAAAGHQAETAELKSLPVRAEEALRAGNDVLVFGPLVSSQEIDEVMAQLILNYEQDETFKERVDESVKKILSYQ